MRRLFACTVGLLLLASCTDGTDPSILDDQTGEEEGLSPTANFEIFDGTSGSEGANPHFFFLPPIAPTTPAYAGEPDLDESPIVTVCPFGSWDPVAETCESPLVVFSSVPDAFGNTVVVGPGGKYRVRWDTDEHEVKNGERFRVVVSLGVQPVGWVDVKAYRNNRYPHSDPDGNVVLTVGGELNIVFRVEEGALESEYCDTANLEDCDVEVFRYDETGCLRVFENPGQTGELLGSRACVPASAARFENGDPVAGEYAVILTLEDQEKQGGAVPANLQLPFFPDLRTDPPGITFDPTSAGVDVVICQAAAGPGSIPEALHPQLRPFVVYSNGTTSLPDDFVYGVPECEGYGSHAHSGASDDASKGFFGRFAAGLTKASAFFLPKPLMARRLHGGLNTTVYNTSGDDGGGDEGGGDNGPEQVGGLLPAGETFVVELGSILDVSLTSSEADVPLTGQVGTATLITINTRDALDQAFPFEVPVGVSATSGPDLIDAVVTYLGNGAYSATYTPTTVGTDVVTVTIDGAPISGGPFESTVSPRSANAAGTTFAVESSDVGGTTTVTVSVVDGEGEPYTYGEEYPIDVEILVTGANTATETATDPDGDGTYVASYTPTAYGDDEVTVTVNGEATGDSPFTNTTTPRPVDPAQSTATVPAEGQVGVESPITIEARNDAGEAYDYPVTRPINVQVAVSGGTVLPAFSVTDDDEDGTYSAAYTPTAVGTDVVTITIDGTEIFGSSFDSEIAPRDADPVGTTFGVSSSEVALPTEVTVDVLDTGGSAYIWEENYPISVEVSVGGANTATLTATDPQGDGTYVASYTPTAYGDDDITVRVNGVVTGEGTKTITTAPRPVDPSLSTATVTSTADVPSGGQVGVENTITIEVRNDAGEDYVYPTLRTIDVQVAVSGDNTVAAFSVTDSDEDGTYIASYTPEFPGTDLIAVTIDGQPISGSPFSFGVAPTTGDLLVDVTILGGAPEDGLPVILYEVNSVGELVEAGSGTTDENGIATIAAVPFGSYTVHLPKRDFDVQFPTGMTQTVDFQAGGQTTVFSGETQPLPAGVEVWRVRDGGLGNAYQYMVGGRSWNSAQNQVQSDVLLGVQGHLVDILSQDENGFVLSFFLNDPNLCPNVSNPKQCKLQGWLGLSDAETEGTFVWTTGEPTSFFNWGNNEPNDSKSNFDHVEIGADGTWSVVNGASSNNEGYFVEWDVTWPITPPSI